VKALLIMLMMLVFVALACAQEINTTTTYCLDNRTMVTQVYRQICIAGACSNNTRESPVVCQWGCNIKRGECYGDPTMTYVAIIAFIVVLIIIGYVLRRIGYV
jgi:hypothetical protein